MLAPNMSAAEISKALATGDEYERGLPLPTVVKDGPFNETQQQILFSSSGEVRPTEMVAILGASGSGKTTLLNLLSQRAKLGSSYCSMAGSVSINGKVLNHS